MVKLNHSETNAMPTLDYLFRQVIEATNDVIVITKADPVEPPGPEIVYVNKAFERLTGFSAEEAIGQSPRILQTKDTSSDARNRIKRALRKQEAIRTTILNESKDGYQYYLEMSIIPLKDADGKVTHFAAIERDVTEQKELQQHLEELSRTDGLTGLLNHRAFHAELEKETNRLKRKNTVGCVAVILLDIDHFKHVNDTYGHDAGDVVLQGLSEIISNEFRRIDCAGRIGGEEFSIVLPDTSAEQARVGAERLRKRVESHPFVIGEHKICVTVSIGIAVHCEQDDDYHTALKHADEALYNAKNSGRNRICLYVAGGKEVEIEVAE